MRKMNKTTDMCFRELHRATPSLLNRLVLVTALATQFPVKGQLVQGIGRGGREVRHQL